MTQPLLSFDFPEHQSPPQARKLASGKVREIYAWGEAELVLIATDRLSAFDVVFGQGIPGKGQVLTQLAAFWFEHTRAIVPNHMITASFGELPADLRVFPHLAGRTTLCRRAEVLPVECVVRGFLEGSAWKEYQLSGSVCGLELPPDLKRRARLAEPVFTPATKAEQGAHDENIDFERCAQIIGRDRAEQVREVAIRLYQFAFDWLDARGIVLADTKFEFGLIDGELVLVDEAFTPDSSRFWTKESLASGGEPVSYDKQYVRDWLETLDWNKQPPAPELPEEVIRNTAARYREIFQKITGSAPVTAG